MDPADEYDDAAAKFVVQAHKFITDQFGEPCDTFDVNCPTCKLWKLYGEMKELVVFK
jgi:hypothetical protein